MATLRNKLSPLEEEQKFRFASEEERRKKEEEERKKREKEAKSKLEELQKKHERAQEDAAVAMRQRRPAEEEPELTPEELREARMAKREAEIEDLFVKSPLQQQMIGQRQAYVNEVAESKKFRDQQFIQASKFLDEADVEDKKYFKGKLMELEKAKEDAEAKYAKTKNRTAWFEVAEIIGNSLIALAAAGSGAPDVKLTRNDWEKKFNELERDRKEALREFDLKEREAERDVHARKMERMREERRIRTGFERALERQETEAEKEAKEAAKELEKESQAFMKGPGTIFQDMDTNPQIAKGNRLLGQWEELSQEGEQDDEKVAYIPGKKKDEVQAQLMALGYKKKEAQDIVRKADNEYDPFGFDNDLDLNILKGYIEERRKTIEETKFKNKLKPYIKALSRKEGISEEEAEARLRARYENLRDVKAAKTVGGRPALSEEDRQAYEWAKSRPNDPDAKKIMENLKRKLGQ